MQAVSHVGEPLVWVDVEWGGMRKISRKTDKEILAGAPFYFPFPFTAQMMRKMKERDKAKEFILLLQKYPEIKVNVWA